MENEDKVPTPRMSEILCYGAIIIVIWTIHDIGTLRIIATIGISVVMGLTWLFQMAQDILEIYKIRRSEP